MPCAVQNGPNFWAMHPFHAIDPDRPTLFCLHFLGGSKREWAAVADGLEGVLRVVTIDLPGFGDAAGLSGYSLSNMADHVAGCIRAVAPDRWLLAGHSMGAKVAVAVARRAEDGIPGLSGLEQLVLLAGSPPAPEPMDEAQRQDLLGWFAAGPEQSRRQAESFISQNSGRPLPAAQHEAAVQDVLRCSPAAWVAWFDRGSREDWRQRIGVLRTPALIVSGTEDADLGPAAQQALMAPHFEQARLVALPGAGHLLPLERPGEVVRLVREAVADRGQRSPSETPQPAPDDYPALIASSRVSAVTREALIARGRPDLPAAPLALSPHQLTTLQAVVDRVLPQSDGPHIDIAGRIDAMLAEGAGDGWRFAALPPDVEAYRLALGTIDAVAGVRHGRRFAALDHATRDLLLQDVARGSLEDPAATQAPRLDPAQMRLWFEDVCADATRLYVSHPATMARLGYSGIGYGGDQPRLSGYREVGIGTREPWEPEAGAVLADGISRP